VFEVRLFGVLKHDCRCCRIFNHRRIPLDYEKNLKKVPRQLPLSSLHICIPGD